MSLEVTERAAKEITRIISEQDFDLQKTMLKMGVRSGGCSGFSYTLDLIQINDNDENNEQFESNGVKIACDPVSYRYIEGTVIDFKDDLTGMGFVFNNPLSAHGCGCGKSFTAEDTPSSSDGCGSGCCSH